MKKTIAIVMALLVIASVSAFGQGVKGQMRITGYGGYSLGFGDAFKDYNVPPVKVTSSAGLTFGGMFHYGVTDKLLVGGEVMFQSYKAKTEITGAYSQYFGYASGSATDTKANFLGNAMYAFNYDDAKAIFLIVGAGIYDSDFGINGGFAYTKQLSPTWYLYVAPRLHIVFSSGATAMLLQLAAGAQFLIPAK